MYGTLLHIDSSTVGHAPGLYQQVRGFLRPGMVKPTTSGDRSACASVLQLRPLSATYAPRVACSAAITSGIRTQRRPRIRKPATFTRAAHEPTEHSGSASWRAAS